MGSKRQKYGPISPHATENAVPMLITASEVVKARSGRFVTLNTTYGSVEIADAGDTLLFGWLEIGDQTTVSGQEGNVILAEGCTERFRIPIITGTLTRAMFGKTCDLVRSSNIQGADLTASGEDVVRIVGGDLVNNEFVDVVFVQAKVTAGTGVV